MSRTNKPRQRRGHGYSRRGAWKRDAKRIGNRRVRHYVRERMKDVLFTDAFDEEGLPQRKEHLFNRLWWD